jgi:hypothetical protein
MKVHAKGPDPRRRGENRPSQLACSAAKQIVSHALIALSLLGPLLNNPASAQDTAVSEHDAVINGVTIHYLRAGSGDSVVLGHGYPEASHTWRHVIPPLARYYTVIATDTRGTGGSSITPDFQLRDVATSSIKKTRFQSPKSMATSRRRLVPAA